MDARITIGLACELTREGFEGVDLLVYPELVDGGYAALKRGEGRHSRGDDLWNFFRALSASRVVVGGSMAMSVEKTGPVMNTSPVFFRGRLIHHYEKIHLFAPAGDDLYFARGRHVEVFSFPFGPRRVKAGLILCYDLRFPELARSMARRGIEILLVPARWPGVRDHAWRTLLQARAIENQIFVVGCNSADREGGASYVVDPLGSVVFASTEAPASTFHRVAIDLGRIAEAHALHRNLADAVYLRSCPLPRLLPARSARPGAQGRSKGRSRRSPPS